MMTSAHQQKKTELISKVKDLYFTNCSLRYPQIYTKELTQTLYDLLIRTVQNQSGKKDSKLKLLIRVSDRFKIFRFDCSASKPVIFLYDSLAGLIKKFLAESELRYYPDTRYKPPPPKTHKKSPDYNTPSYPKQKSFNFSTKPNDHPPTSTSVHKTYNQKFKARTS
jgi:hypothetical protein